MELIYSTEGFAATLLSDAKPRSEQVLLSQPPMLRGNWTRAWSLCWRCHNEVLDIPVGVTTVRRAVNTDGAEVRLAGT